MLSIYERRARQVAGPASTFLLAAVAWLAMASLGHAQTGQEEQNKALARRFYEQIWFSRNLDAVNELVAPEYVIHDIGGLDGVTEPAGQQAAIADFLWQHGEMTGHIDFQIADGDLVATRWQWEYAPTTWWMKLLQLGGRPSVPIINVFRFDQGQIVEIWNHRHDIDVGFPGNILRIQGFLAGIVVTLVGSVGWRRWRGRRRPRSARP